VRALGQPGPPVRARRRAGRAVPRMRRAGAGVRGAVLAVWASGRSLLPRLWDMEGPGQQLLDAALRKCRTRDGRLVATAHM